MNYGTFSGTPKTEWLSDNGPDRNMRLLEGFWYTDSAGRQWDAPKGSVVNGASIPEALWSYVGNPYTGEYRRASVVHDVACDTPGVDRREADDMFYWACLAGGCSTWEAAYLYLGVRIGAWTLGTDLASVREVRARPRFEAEYSRSELAVRAMFILQAYKLSLTPGDFDAIKAVIDKELGR